MRAVERLETVQTRLRNCEKEFEAAKEAAKRAKEEFEDVKEQRLELFNKAFGHISEQIDHVYKELTRNPAFPMGGNAYVLSSSFLPPQTFIYIPLSFPLSPAASPKQSVSPSHETMVIYLDLR